MNRRLRFTAALLIFCSVVWLLPLGALAGDSDNDGYHDGDAALLRTFLEQKNTDVNRHKKNGEVLSEKYSSSDPSTWEGVVWTDAVPRRIARIRWDGRQLFGDLSLKGAAMMTSLSLDRNRLTSLDVTGCTLLESLSVDQNWLQSLTLGGNERMGTLSCSENRLSELGVSGAPVLRNLDCSKNLLPFSVLPLKLPVQGGSYVYAPQSYVHIRLLNGQTADLTKEAVVGGQSTVFVWKDEDGNVLSGKEMSSDRGRFSFWGDHIGQVIHCVMENPAFPALSGDMALRTDYVRVNFRDSVNSEGMETQPPKPAKIGMFLYVTELTGTLNGTVSKASLDNRVMDTFLLVIAYERDAERRLVVRMAASSGASAVELEISRGYFDRIAASQGKPFSLQLETQFGSLLLDGEALAYVSKHAGEGNILLRVGKAGTFLLTEPVKSRVGYRPSASVSVGTSAEQLKTVEGTVVLSLSYPTRNGEEKDGVMAYEVSALGSRPAGVLYERNKWEIHIAANRLSNYAVAYLGKPVYSDVNSGAWFFEAAAFVHDRGIAYDRGNGRFGPDDPLTRGELVYMLMRALDLKPQTDELDTFTDAGGDFYSPYLAAAKRLGIVEGMGNNRFQPETRLTRQDMCVMLYRALKKLGKLPGSDGSVGLSGYPDKDRVADYAREAMAALTQAGVVSGYGGRLEPEAFTSRAQLSQILYKLLADQ